MGNFIFCDKRGKGHLKISLSPLQTECGGEPQESKFTGKNLNEKCRHCETFIRAECEAVCKAECEMTFLA